MKVAIYCRVSTREQTTENQEIRLVEYAKRNNWKYELFKEVESSRGTRPLKQTVLSKLRKKEFDSLLIYKLDRWARSTIELTMELTELYNKGINIISISDNIDLSTATGKLQFQILSAFAEFERNIIRERTLEGLHRARTQGKQLGRPIGSKDSKQRRKAGYFLKEAKKRQKEDETKGLHQPIDYYLNNPPSKNKNKEDPEKVNVSPPTMII